MKKTNYKKKTEKFTYIWGLNKMLVNTNESKKNSKEKKNYLETNKNVNTIHQNSQDEVKAVLSRKFIMAMLTSRNKKTLK